MVQPHITPNRPKAAAAVWYKSRGANPGLSEAELGRVLKFISAICTSHFAAYLAQIQVT